MPPPAPAVESSLARTGVAGFFLSGLLLAFLGAILPAWGYHLRDDYLTVGRLFLAMNLGLAVSACLVHYALRGRTTAAVLVVGCGTACAALLCLAMVPPAAAAWWRLLGILGLGAGAGLLNCGVFQAISPLYRRDSVATVYLAGTFFGLGCVVISLLVAGTFYVYTVPSTLVLVAAIPGFFACIYAKTLAASRAAALGGEMRLGTGGWKEAWTNLTNPAAVMFALLLFFQFGNEWSIAGWLPLFLCKRLGVSPASSLQMLALYWLALLVGRVAAAAALPMVSHGKLLGGSVLAALSGCTILVFTDNRFGAVSGILLVGGGFASVYPLVVEKIGGRFPAYHPGFFNGIFSFAVTGGLLAPWSLGIFADRWGVGAVMAVPLLGTLMVLLLLLLIWAEAKFTAGGE